MIFEVFTKNFLKIRKPYHLTRISAFFKNLKNAGFLNISTQKMLKMLWKTTIHSLSSNETEQRDHTLTRLDNSSFSMTNLDTNFLAVFKSLIEWYASFTALCRLISFNSNLFLFWYSNILALSVEIKYFVFRCDKLSPLRGDELAVYSLANFSRLFNLRIKTW